MKPKKLNLRLLCVQFTDVLYQRLHLSLIDRAVYFYLLRHTRLEGKQELHCSMTQLAQGIGLSTRPIRDAVRRLAVLGALRLVQRTKQGHVIEVRLPDEIRDADPSEIGAEERPEPPRSRMLEKMDFMKTRGLRQYIHLRERGHCFYCLRRTDVRVQCIDHVVPLAKRGKNSYRNLVSCCLECNSQKGERSAGDFLRQLYRERRLTAGELHARLRRLDALAAGQLAPVLEHADAPLGNGRLPDLRRRP